jgi:hypothetical protein
MDPIERRFDLGGRQRVGADLREVPLDPLEPAHRDAQSSQVNHN